MAMGGKAYPRKPPQWNEKGSEEARIFPVLGSLPPGASSKRMVSCPVKGSRVPGDRTPWDQWSLCETSSRTELLTGLGE